MKLQLFKGVECTNTNKTQREWICLSLVSAFANPCYKQHCESNQMIKSKISTGLMGVQYLETNGFKNLLHFVWWHYHQQVQRGVSLAACSVFCITHRICGLQYTGMSKTMYECCFSLYQSLIY